MTEYKFDKNKYRTIGDLLKILETFDPETLVAVTNYDSEYGEDYGFMDKEYRIEVKPLYVALYPMENVGSYGMYIGVEKPVKAKGATILMENAVVL